MTGQRCSPGPAPAESMSQHQKRLIRACTIVNADPDVRAIEEEFDALNESISELWEDARSR